MEHCIRSGAAMAAAALLAGCATAGDPPIVFLAAEADTIAPGEASLSFIDPLRLAAAGLYDFEQLDAFTPAPIDPRLIILAKNPTAPARVAAHDAAFVEHFGGAGFRKRVAGFRVAAAEGVTDVATGATPQGWTMIAEDRFRHLASGLECPLALRTGGENAGRLDLVSVTQHDVGNNDVSCLYRSGGAAMLSVHATHWPETTLEAHAAGAIAALRVRLAKADPLPLPSIRARSASPTEGALAAAFDAGPLNGEPYKAALWIDRIGGWHIKSTAFYPQADIAAERISAMHFSISRDRVAAREQSRQALQQQASPETSL